jgi:hypothetical protein
VCTLAGAAQHGFAHHNCLIEGNFCFGGLTERLKQDWQSILCCAGTDVEDIVDVDGVMQLVQDLGIDPTDKALVRFHSHTLAVFLGSSACQLLQHVFLNQCEHGSKHAPKTDVIMR